MTQHMPDQKATQNTQPGCSPRRPASSLGFSRMLEHLHSLLMLHQHPSQGGLCSWDCCPAWRWLPQLAAPLCLAFEARHYPPGHPISHSSVQMKVYAGIACTCLSMKVVPSIFPESAGFCMQVEEREEAFYSIGARVSIITMQET